MSKLRLTCALWDYDRTRPLMDGRIAAEGIELDIQIVRPGKTFQRMLETGEFDVCEMSLSAFAILNARGECPFVSLPVPLSKIFRHSCIYVRTASGIASPADLKGKRVGTPQYSATGIVFLRGMLKDEYGISPEDMHWFTGGLNKPGEKPRLPLNLPVPHEVLNETQTLEQMFEAGELDVLFANQIPSLFLNGSPSIARLFPDYRPMEKDYFRRTGVFPIMHIVVVRNDVFRANPWVAASLYRAFGAARDLAVEGLYDSDALRLSLPFLLHHMEEARQVFGQDFWPYGVEPNRATWDALCRYVYEQGLAPRLLTADELFAPGL
jgi:4,5-dihydroxyphthalate decarboxylase